MKKLGRILALATVGIAGMALAMAAGGGGVASADAKSIFCSDFVPNEKASWNAGAVLYKWARANPGEVSRWTVFANGICADQVPSAPAMATLHGKTLLAAGRMALPDTPPPTTTTTTTTTTTEPPPTTTTEPPPTTTTEPPPGSPTLQQIDGGLSYYGQFSNPLPVSSSYFPIGVWGSYAHETANRDKDAAVGINTYVWVGDNSYMDDIRADGRFKVIQDEGNRTGVGTETAGWLLADEMDMQQGPSACPDQINAIKAGLPQDGRATYANYGKGIFPGWETDDEFTCFVEAQDLQSDDIYWFTDPNVCGSISEGPSLFGLNRALTTAECRRASNYGVIVNRMRTLDARNGIRKPIWAFVEIGWPFTESAAQGGRAILPAELRAAVWHSIIAGARGIIYFQHSFGGPCIGHHGIRGECYPENAAMATQVDAQIRQLAPVLNSPSLSSGFSASSSVRALAKWDGSNFYVFAGSSENVSSTGSFSLPCVGSAMATVVGESRSLAVSSGAWSDGFANGNAVHIYRIDGGSRCGL